MRRHYGAGWQALVVFLVTAQAGAAMPAATPQATPPAPEASGELERSTIPEPIVEVNRTLPEEYGVPRIPSFGFMPSDADITSAVVFEEPLAPMDGIESFGENRALTMALTLYLSAGHFENVEPLEAFLKTHPTSRWRAALLTNVGLVYRRHGYLTRALAAWEEAWALGKEAKGLSQAAVVDRALAELADLNARLGRYERLQPLYEEVKDRDVHGSPAETLVRAWEGLWTMKNKPEIAFRCGPLALDRLADYGKEIYSPIKVLTDAPSTARGTSLTANATLALSAGLNLQPVFRKGGEIIIPALVHWKVGHFAALVQAANGRLLFRDPTFGNEFWVSQAAFEGETSGYFLVPAGPLPLGWRSVSATEGETVWGKGYTSGQNPQATKPCSDSNGGCGEGVCPANGMAEYRIHTMLVSLSITDVPVGYRPPLGPPVAFRATYNQREASQPSGTQYSNLGPKWTTDWTSYVSDSENTLGEPVNIAIRGGGQETYTFNGGDTSSPHRESRAVLVRTSSVPIRYERRSPNGSVDVYAHPLNQSDTRRVFLTESRDPQGKAMTFAYQAEKLVAVADAIGQVTTIDHVPGTQLIARVIDPFGRFASFDYDTQGRLRRIVDVVGLSSEFGYGTGDFVSSMTTPYGTIAFAKVEPSDTSNLRSLEAVDPLGGKERVEFRHGAPDPIPVPGSESAVPVGIVVANENLQHRNTFYWDKRAMALYPGVYEKARITHWLHDVGGVTADVAESRKEPLESRVWYEYPGQGSAVYTGTAESPSKIARVLDGGSTQLYQYEYNAKGKVCRAIDPLGRETRSTYGTNNVADAVCTSGSSIDLLKVEQKNGASWDVVQTATYNSLHEPLTTTDAALQTTTYTYLPDSTGRLQTIATPTRNGHDGNPLSVAERTTTYEYFPDNEPVGPFQLRKTTGPSVSGITGRTSSLTYDGYGRVRTTTDTDGYLITVEYDTLDRPTKTTYPDGSYEETKYNRLDAEGRRDRLGRWSHTFHDALRRPRASRDPLGRTTTINWCSCGSLDGVTDAAGNATTWDRDLQGRTRKELRADGRFWEYTYENTTSRLKTIKDPKLQEKTFSYDLDDRLTAIGYTGEVISTTDVTFSYRNGQNLPDPYGRLLSMVDGTGFSTYDYHPVGVLGATRLKSVDGPGATDVLEYAYDELGRVRDRKLNGTANQVTFRFDSLDRLHTQTTPVGSFTYGYEGVTGRHLSLLYPNGQRVDYAHFGNSGDHRLQQIHNKLPGGATLSKFDYNYDDVGNIGSWSQQRGASAAETYNLGYDNADQLWRASLKGSTGAVLKTYGYAYDKAGNRTVEAKDLAVTVTSHDSRNRIASQIAGGSLPVTGVLSEPATVTVNTAPASVGADNQFAGQVQAGTGTQTVIVAATDASGSTRTNTYQVAVTGSAVGPFTYDDNGNLTSNGPNTYLWDAENRLVEVKQGANAIATFVYDGRGRRYQKTSGGVTRTFLYDNARLAEERLSTGGTIKYFDGLGIDQHLATQDQTGAVTYFTADRLGSVTDVTTSAGAVTVTRQYDPWGNLLQGSNSSGYAFTGREWDAEIGLYYYRARYYDSRLGRFLSEDPAGLLGGFNLYQYADNDPAGLRDPFGLKPSDPQAECWAVAEPCIADAYIGFTLGLIGCGVLCNVAPLSAQARVVCILGCVAIVASYNYRKNEQCFNDYEACLILKGVIPRPRPLPSPAPSTTSQC